jgi:transcriptional regulator with XRE-family HTH domain
MAVRKSGSSSAGSTGKQPKRKKIETPALSRPEGGQSSTYSKDTEKKRLAVGALLTFYRRLREVQRKGLAEISSISVSLLGMIENGDRLPSAEVLERLGSKLDLNAYQQVQLHAIAGYSTQLPEAPGWEVRADDLIQGVPLFLRNMKLESDFQDKLDIEETWIVTRRPLALDEPILSMLKNKLLNTNAAFAYFVDARTGGHDFVTLWDRLDLESDPTWNEKRKRRTKEGKPEQFTCVLSPPTLCASTHTIALFNPRSVTRPRFGRAAYYGGSAPLGVYALDLVLVDQLVGLLKDVYIDCEKNPGQAFPKDPSIGGAFTLLQPKPLR